MVEDGKMITAAGVSAGIDMALQLVEREAGRRGRRRRSSSAIEYDPQPPFDSGSPAKAPQAVVEAVSAAFAASDDWLAGRAGGGV